MPPPTTAAALPSLRPLTAERNALGRLVVGGCDTVELVARFESPLYVLDEATLRAACRAYTGALAAAYPPGGRVLYAGKALCITAVCALVHQEGLGLDVVSAGEYMTARAAGVPAAALVLQGNNKPAAELRMGLTEGVGRVNVDNLDELRLVIDLAAELAVHQDILLRVAPGIEAHTHDFIRTGQEDSKFGFDLKSGQVDTAMAWLAAQDRVRCLGLQAHIGSQIYDASAFEKTADVMVGLLADLKARHGFIATELDLGGGLGIPHLPDDEVPAIAETVHALAAAVLAACQQHGVTPPHLVLEPGRSIVGTAGITLYTVGGRKVVPGVRTYVAVDGGMADNPRPITYQATYTAELASSAAGREPELVTIAGRYCESGDILITDALLPRLESGDLLAVLGTGAYNHSMASNYNRCGRPAMVLVHDGQADVIVARETFADLTRLDRLPSHLQPGPP